MKTQEYFEALIRLHALGDVDQVDADFEGEHIVLTGHCTDGNAVATTFPRPLSVAPGDEDALAWYAWRRDDADAARLAEIMREALQRSYCLNGLLREMPVKHLSASASRSGNCPCTVLVVP